MTRTALITGGSGGIGRACGRRLAELGYDVVLAARRQDRLAQIAEELNVEGVVADVTDEDDVLRLCGVRPSWSVLVHAAGTLDGSDIAQQPTDVFDDVYRTLLRSTYMLSKHTAARMAPGGRQILMGSTAGLRPMKGLSAYSAFKAGLNAFAAVGEAELEEHGIGVHVIAPGPVDTPMLRHRWHSLVPDDVADAVAFLVGLRPGVAVPLIEMRMAKTGPFAPDLTGGSAGVGEV
ncbi:SDR family oxidoreductase [Euzebya sp.]|uniref:SDR family oxidoreductase n=1 Tax=Euzebya sp. TaxID=1971409 RepID=UPI0035164CDC